MKTTAWLLLAWTVPAFAQAEALAWTVPAFPQAEEEEAFIPPPLIEAQAAQAPTADVEQPAQGEHVTVAALSPRLEAAPAAEVSTRVDDAPVRPSEEGTTFFGVSLDAGVPDGVGASLVVRPLRWLRLSVGATTTLFTTGIRGGVSLVPFHFWITPSLTIDGGFLPEGDANMLVRTFGGDASFSTPALEKVSYAYANAHLGLEVGSPRRFSVYLRGGLSYLDGALGGFQALLQQADPTVQSSNLRVRGTVPSAKLGFLLYLL